MGLINAILGRDDPPEEVIENCKVDIKVMFSEVDLKEGEAWIETEYGFLFGRGSAVIEVHFVTEEDGTPYVVFYSPIVQLPLNNLLAFYRRLLELNFDLGGQVAVGVDHDTVSVSASRAIAGLTEEGLVEVMGVVSGVADDLDDHLHEEFGAPFYEPEEE